MTIKFGPAALAMIAVPAVAISADTEPWQVDLIQSFAKPQVVMTFDRLHADLASLAAIRITPACAVGFGPGPSAAPAMLAMTVSALGTCAGLTPVVKVQLLLQHVPQPSLSNLQRDIEHVSGRPCFDGVYAPDTRRRAPPLHLVAWSDQARDLVLTQDSSVPDGVSITFQRNDLHSADVRVMSRYREALRETRAVLPASCRPVRE